MSEVTEILEAIERGDESSTDALLPIVYDELRRIAASKLSRETPGITLQTTSLVHEAYMRLIGPAADADEAEGVRWDSRGHFFAAAAESMRRILIDHARRKKQLKRGGDREKIDLEHVDFAAVEKSVDLLALDEALNKLEEEDSEKANVVKLRYFAGLTIEETARALGVSEPTVKRRWFYARAWLRREIEGGSQPD